MQARVLEPCRQMDPSRCSGRRVRVSGRGQRNRVLEVVEGDIVPWLGMEIRWNGLRSAGDQHHEA